MSNYTTKTAALKATTIDTRLLDTKRIDTQKLFIGGSTLEEVILQTSPKGINNAVKISTTLGSILDKEITTGNYVVRITRGGAGAFLQIEDNNGGFSITPVSTCIHVEQIMVNWSQFYNGWECQLWEDGDDYT